jgi:hypothetical protein
MGVGFLGRGIELWRKTGGGDEGEGEGRPGGRETAAQSAICLSLFVVFPILARS